MLVGLVKINWLGDDNQTDNDDDEYPDTFR